MRYRIIGNERTIRRRILISAILIVNGILIAASTQPPTPQEILDRYAATQEKLKSFIIREETIPIEARSTMKQMQIPYIRGDGKPTTEVEMRSDGRRAKWYNRMWGHVGMVAEDTPFEKAKTNMRLWDGKTSWQYDSTAEPGYEGILWVNPGVKKFDTIEGCLRGFFYCDGGKRVDTVLREAEKLTVAAKPTLIGGGACWLVETQCKYGRYQVWFDADHGWQIARAYMQKRPGDQWNAGTMVPDTLIYYALQDIRFERIDDVWVPMEVEQRIVHDFGKAGKYESQDRLRRTGVILNPDHDKLGSFEPTEVDDGTSIPFYLNTAGFHHIVDPEFMWLRESPFHVDARGRLPRTADAVIPFPIVKKVRNLRVLAGKENANRFEKSPVLLCFWDVAQADSQSQVRELALKAEELAKRGVGVLLVETDPANRDKAADWVRTNQVPFVSGGFPPHENQHSVSERIVEWRIDRLPWLVLANAEQIIVAEGLEIAELAKMADRLNVDSAGHGGNIAGPG